MQHTAFVGRESYTARFHRKDPMFAALTSARELRCLKGCGQFASGLKSNDHGQASFGGRRQPPDTKNVVSAF
jgi:hypothetical protein